MRIKTKIRLQMFGLVLLKIISLLSLLGVIICAPVGFFRMIVKSADGESEGTLLIVAIVCLVVSLITGLIFKYSYKKVIVENVLNQELPGCVWSPNDGFGQGVIDSNIRLVESGNKYKTEDLIYGEYNGYHYEQSDVKIENVIYERTGYGRHRHTKIRVYKHFQGRMIILDSPIVVKKPVFVFSYTFEHRYSGLYDKLTSDEIKDKVFGDVFDVKVEKGGSARNVLDDKMKKALLTTYNKFNNMAVRFEEKKMYIAINTKESTFDWRWTRGFSFRKEVEANRKQMDVIKDIIDIISARDENKELEVNDFKQIEEI
ncbi:MAG: DUF3137 domain-containing protein [Lachnospiraceae bacterium]|nr:DUF3137 domain-containing protein [Lachnospiraceae bacterium]